MSRQTIIFPPVSESETESAGFRIPGRSVPGKTIALDAEVASDLVRSARQAAESAHAPYSKFRVGSAALMADDPGGQIFAGCNVENASFGATVCAERNAIFQAAAEGFRQISLLAVSTIGSLDGPLEGRSPCGVCRQVISEFAVPETLVLIDTAAEGVLAEVVDIDRLLPFRFELNSGGGGS